MVSVFVGVWVGVGVCVGVCVGVGVGVGVGSGVGVGVGATGFGVGVGVTGVPVSAAYAVVTGISKIKSASAQAPIRFLIARFIGFLVVLHILSCMRETIFFKLLC